ncbi:MAG: IclR family transcriptional regulator [Candidatus Dormiibacterota bacterium]
MVGHPHSSATRALRALEAVADDEEPKSLATLSRTLSVPKSTLHSLLRALAVRHYLELDEHGNYQLGVACLHVGTAYMRRFTALVAAGPELFRLSRELGVTAHFAVLEGADALYLAKEDPPTGALRLASAVGIRLPAHLTAVGKANLAHLPKGVALPDISPPLSRVAEASLQTELAEVRAQGFAVDQGAVMPGVCCVAAPVFDGSRRCCGTIGVSFLGQAQGSLETAASAVVDSCRRASLTLGLTSP